MTTETDICNRALSSIATRSTIAGLQETSPEAQQCRLLYAPTRDALLRSAHWNFCAATAYLNLLKAAPGTPENPNAQQTNTWVPSTTPRPPWLYSYAIPSDSLLLRQILPQQALSGLQGTPISSVPSDFGPPPFIGMRGARFIVATDTVNGNDTTVALTNVDTAIGIYTKRITLPDLWDPQFQEAMVAALAWRLALPLSGDKKMAQMQHDAAVQIINEVRVSDGNEGTTNVSERLPDWLSVRGVGLDWCTVGGYLAAYANPSFLVF